MKPVIDNINVIHNTDILSQASFYVDWSKSQLGVLNKDGTKSESKGDFAIQLEMLVEAGTKTGYIATVKRAIDGDERYINN